VRKRGVLVGTYRRSVGDHLDVDWVPGTASLVRRHTVETVGLLSERFFMYGEDIEWFWCMRRAGFRIGVCGSAPFVHEGSISAARTWTEQERVFRTWRGVYQAVILVKGPFYTRTLAALTALACLVEKWYPRRTAQHRQWACASRSASHAAQRWPDEAATPRDFPQSTRKELPVSEQTIADLYLSLLKDTLAFLLWDEPGVPAEALQASMSRRRRAVVRLAVRLGRLLGLRVYVEPRYSESQRVDGMIWPALAFTMVGRPRLDNIQACVMTVLRDGIPGDLIEAGTWRGGVGILMRALLRIHGAEDRRVFVADSFEGLPRPDPARFPHDAGDQHHTFSYLAVPLAEVKRNFTRFGMLDDHVVFLKGWFKDTLRDDSIARLAIARIDGDMYGSTMDALEALYPKLSPGGFCVVDDYALPGCRRAVDDFRGRLGLIEPLTQIDWTGVYWRKEQEARRV
jgi:O-methyltransferase